MSGAKRTIPEGRPLRFGVDYSLAGYRVVGVLDESGSAVPLGVIWGLEHVDRTEDRDVWSVTVSAHPDES